MTNRHLSRSILIQSLFEWDFRGRDNSRIEEIIIRDVEEFSPDKKDLNFVKNITVGIIEKIDKLDSIIEKAAPQWPIDRISVVDRNVLRLGIYELLFSDRKEVPAKVAINEAIELAKSFGGINSGKFVSGVLGTIYKELGEPGKDEVGRKKIADVPYEKMPIEKLGGAVVYAKKDGEIYLALVHDVFGHWTLSKGRIEENEDEVGGTIREIKEEIGLDIKIDQKLDVNEYIASNPEKGKLRKQVTYFLAVADFNELKLEKEGGLDGARWFKVSEIADLSMYDDILPIVAKGIKLIPK